MDDNERKCKRELKLRKEIKKKGRKPDKKQAKGFNLRAERVAR